MLYHYIASGKDGKLVEADHDADSLGDVLRYLGTQELRPVSVKPVKQGGSIVLFGGKIDITDKVFLTKYLALMLKVGTDLLSAINILISDFEKPMMKNFLLEVRENLSHGQPFYIAFEKHPKWFSRVMVSLIKAAESSGNLQLTFENLSVSLEKDAELRNKVRSALIYPVIILSASLSVFLFLAIFALPKIADVFLKGGINPPIFSRIVFGVGLFMGDHVFAVLGTLAVSIVSIVLFFAKTSLGKRVSEEFMRRMPVIKKVHKEGALQRFAATYGALLKAGLPIVEATRITADVTGSEEFRLALLRIADEGLSKGLTIGEAFRRETVFPKVVVNLIAISEKAGHTEEVLLTLADFYAANVDAGVKTLVSFLEPALLLFMGLLVGGIALSIIVPIYQLTSQF